MKKLFIFTNSFPFGDGENWLYTEVKILAENFDIRIIPLVAPRDAGINWELPEQIKIGKPLFEQVEKAGPASLKYIFRIFRGSIKMNIAELVNKRILFSRSRLYKFLQFLKLAQSIQTHPDIKSILATENATLYFYWGLGIAQILPFIKRSAIKCAIAVRMHGYDLYEFRNSGYIPFRNGLMYNSDIILPVSQNGVQYLAEKYPLHRNKIKIARLGTVENGHSKPGSNGVLNLFSCSSIISLKRVHLIAEALKGLEGIKVEWKHIGHGPEFERVKQICEKLPTNIKVNFIGQIPAQEVAKLYASSEVDLFINVSETEGVPVSIMEAMAAGIPVYATNVGGVSEIIDQSVGKLLPAELNADLLAEEILRFNRLSVADKQQLRQSAIKRYRERCDAIANAKKLSELLASL